jgi:hypothetical protein
VASSKDENEWFKVQMWTMWTISNLGDVHLVVGIAVEWDCPNHTVMLSQTALIDYIILQFGQVATSPLRMPMAPGLKLHHLDSSSLSKTD